MYHIQLGLVGFVSQLSDLHAEVGGQSLHYLCVGTAMHHGTSSTKNTAKGRVLLLSRIRIGQQLQLKLESDLELPGLVSCLVALCSRYYLDC